MTRVLAASGFSVVELIVAVAIMLVVTGAIFGLTHPAQAMFQVEPERADMQQRLRIAVEAISRDLMMAGAGGQLSGGATVPGRSFATVLPLRRGHQSADAPGAFFQDRISVVYEPAAAPETTVSEPVASASVVPVQPQPGCPATAPLCGFRANQLAAVYDATGAHDIFRIVAVQDSPPLLLGDGALFSRVYDAGAVVAEVEAVTYWVHDDVRVGVHRLMRYDGWQTDTPVADNILALRFEYFGDPTPPVLRRALDDPQGPWTSYGPKPPLADVDDASTPSYGSGENCVFAVDNGVTITRLEMRDLGSSFSSVVRLDAQQLTDGPWCPDPTSPVRFDADLLRIRRVRVTLQVRSARRFVFAQVPDLEIAFDVAPRNLGN
ncbi:MAG: hypothetical protein ND807_14325 [Vicinamibacterales bacterium]|nr:hypothetical protein [Vicinamibacterales bacterium]